MAVIALGAVALLIVVRHRRWWHVMAVAIVALCTLANLALSTAAVHQDVLTRTASDGAVVELEVVLDGDPRLRVGRHGGQVETLAHVRQVHQHPSSWRLDIPILVRGEVGRAVAGDTVHGSFRLEEADAREGIAAVARPVGVPEVHRTAMLHHRVLHRIRSAFIASCDPLPEPARGLLPALVMGDTSRVGQQTKDDFTRTNLTHVMAVSGTNLTIVLSCMALVLSWCGVRARARTAALVLTVASFVGLCGPEPSVLRAAAMGLVGMAAVGRGQQGGRALRHLCLAIIILLFLVPALARGWGFALSCAATTGLILFARPWADALSRWLPLWLAELIAIPLSAQVLTEPLVVALSGAVGGVGLAANLMAEPFVGPATVLGFLAAALACVCPWLGSVVAVPGGWCCTAIAQVASHFAGLPGAQIPWATGWQAWATILAILSLFVWRSERILARPWACLLLAVLMAITLAKPVSRIGWPPPAWDVVVCDVGQGGAVVARGEQGRGILVDVGPSPRLIRSCLDSLGIRRLDVVILTHDHADHAGALPDVLGGFSIGLVVLSQRASATRGSFLPAIAGRAIPVVIAQEGDSWSAGAARFTALSILPGSPETPPVGRGESAEENDGSIAGELTSGGVTVLITGDLDRQGQQHLLPRVRPVDAVIAPHHGSSKVTDDFFDSLPTRLCLIGVGVDNDYGHPAPSTLRRLSSAGYQVVRTDHVGAIALSGGGSSPTLTLQFPQGKAQGR